ncbi:hypothetical protein D3C76_762180 [compost metagenome]
MAITIKVRMSCSAYQARAMRLGVTASSAESAKAAAMAVCRKLGADPELLEHHALGTVQVEGDQVRMMAAAKSELVHQEQPA